MTKYRIINYLTCTTADTKQIVILLLECLIIQKLKNVFVPSNFYMEQPTKFASELHFEVPSIHSKNKLKVT